MTSNIRGYLGADLMQERTTDSQVGPHQKFVVDEQVVAAELDGEIVLLNIETGSYFGLESVAAEIWRVLSAPMSQVDLETRLLDEFDVGPDILRVDLNQFVGMLLEKGLVRAIDV